MKPILIIKAGSTLPHLKSRTGDFEDWIIAGGDKARSEFMVTPVYENFSLPQPDYISAVIISGSHANVSDNLPWMHKTNLWLQKAAAANIPMLGICFGHQMIAHSFGGRVDFNPAGWELGLVPVNFNAEAQTDALMSCLPTSVNLFVSHSQSVLALPAGAVHLASSAKEPVQAYRYQKNIWGVQFHPEFNLDITQAYLEFHNRELAPDQQNPPLNRITADPKNWGENLLKQFVKIVENH